MTSYQQLNATDQEDCLDCVIYQAPRNKSGTNLWVEALVITFVMAMWAIPLYGIPALELLYGWGAVSSTDELGEVRRKMCPNGFKSQTSIETDAKSYVLSGNADL